jgi:hypothetical protein
VAHQDPLRRVILIQARLIHIPMEDIPRVIRIQHRIQQSDILITELIQITILPDRQRKSIGQNRPAYMRQDKEKNMTAMIEEITGTMESTMTRRRSMMMMIEGTGEMEVKDKPIKKPLDYRGFLIFKI